MNLHVTFEEFNGIIHVYETNKDGGGRYQLGAQATIHIMKCVP